jgi:hypothetical protein
MYVMDCRRPVHLANVHAKTNVVVFWGVQIVSDIPIDGDILLIENNDESSNSDSESSSEEEE